MIFDLSLRDTMNHEAECIIYTCVYKSDNFMTLDTS